MYQARKAPEYRAPDFNIVPVKNPVLAQMPRITEGATSRNAVMIVGYDRTQVFKSISTVWHTPLTICVTAYEKVKFSSGSKDGTL